MKKSPRVIVVMPAHNAAKTLKKAYQRLPHKYISEIILVDDASTDNTYELAKKLPIKTYRNQINLGYGGNLKMCLYYALKENADIIIEFHPDNQYDPKSIPVFLNKARNGYDFALGSRFIHPKEALDRKMPLIKFIANRCLSFVDQFVLGIELSEFHSGLRMYSKEFLTNVPFMQNSDDYLFSFEIIVQAVFYKFKIAEVEIQCDYHPQMHTANLYKSSIYALGTFKTLIQYINAKFYNHLNGPFKRIKIVNCPICKKLVVRQEFTVKDAVSNKYFLIFFCVPCQIGFTYPKPIRLSKFYPPVYYSKIKNFIYKIMQFRRPMIIKSLIKSGKILDIGCGDGNLSTQLDLNRYYYVGIETAYAKITNPLIKSIGVENMHEKSNSYDLVTFWESLEHINNPLTILKKSFKLLKRGGYLIIECPNYLSWEKIPFQNHWFHLDPPRHLFHYSEKGLVKLLMKSNYRIVFMRHLYCPEYIPLGLAQSLLYIISPSLNVFARNYHNKISIWLPFILCLVAIFMLPISLVFYLMRGSPILLMVAKKQ